MDTDRSFEWVSALFICVILGTLSLNGSSTRRGHNGNEGGRGGGARGGGFGRRGRFGGHCYNCGRTGHMSKYCKAEKQKVKYNTPT